MNAAEHPLQVCLSLDRDSIGWLDCEFKSGPRRFQASCSWNGDVPRDLLAALLAAHDTGEKHAARGTDESRSDFEFVFRRVGSHLEFTVGSAPTLSDDMRVRLRCAAPAREIAAAFATAFAGLVAPPSSPQHYQQRWGSPFPQAEFTRLCELAGRSDGGGT